MTPESLITEMLENYGRTIMLTFSSLIASGFILILVKNFIKDLANYFRARMSDIGRGQRIYYSNEIFIIDKITFKFIEAHDDKKVILIPIENYMAATREYPMNRHDDFDKSKYYAKPWDGKVDRRKSRKN